MTRYSLDPAFIKLNYHSGYAPHSMTLPTRAWIPTAGDNGLGGYESWAVTEVDALDMVTGLVNLMKVLMPTGVTFDDFTIYTQDGADAVAVPKAGAVLAITGTEASPGWTRAVQRTFNFFDTEYHAAKIVLLDADSNDLFTKVTGASASVAELAVAEEYSLLTNAWASRAGFKPYVFRDILTTINTKLRDSYVV